jgi:N-acetylglutamate synthase-like GNAT family acetyltransferase
MSALPLPSIRLATPEDSPALTDLASQLGYPSTLEQVVKRLNNLIEKPEENAVFVAELDGRVVGWVHVHLYLLLVDDLEAEIGGLVVDADLRGQGVGAQLMAAAEAWARENGCQSVYLRSNTLRTEAHAFYRHLGYSLIKSQYAFRKVIR